MPHPSALFAEGWEATLLALPLTQSVQRSDPNEGRSCVARTFLSAKEFLLLTWGQPPTAVRSSAARQRGGLVQNRPPGKGADSCKETPRLFPVLGFSLTKSSVRRSQNPPDRDSCISPTTRAFPVVYTYEAVPTKCSTWNISTESQPEATPRQRVAFVCAKWWLARRHKQVAEPCLRPRAGQ